MRTLAMRTYVINLERSTDRWRAFLERSGAHLSDMQRFEGVDGRNTRCCDIPELGLDRSGDAMANGNIGCLISHVRVWAQVANQPGACIVCEDDAQLPADFEARVAEAIAALPAGWGMLNLYHNQRVNIKRTLAGRLPTINLIAANPSGQRLNTGLVCYAMSPDFARHLVRSVVPIDKALPIFADYHYQYFWSGQFPVYFVQDCIAKHDHGIVSVRTGTRPIDDVRRVQLAQQMQVFGLSPFAFNPRLLNRR